MGFTTGAIVAVCCYAIVYFGVCLRMVWDEVKGIAHFMLYEAGIPGRVKTQSLRGDSLTELRE